MSNQEIPEQFSFLSVWAVYKTTEHILFSCLVNSSSVSRNLVPGINKDSIQNLNYETNITEHTHSTWLNKDKNNIQFTTRIWSILMGAVAPTGCRVSVSNKWGKKSCFKCVCQFSVRTRWYFWVSTRPKAILSPCYEVRPVLNLSGSKIWGGNVSYSVTAAPSVAFKLGAFCFFNISHKVSALCVSPGAITSDLIDFWTFYRMYWLCLVTTTC